METNGCKRQIFHRSSHLLLLCNFPIQSYQSSISIALHPRPVILNHYLSSSMTSVLFSPPLQPHPMNLSSPVTNIYLDNPADTLTSQFLSLLSSFNLSQHVHFPTHDKNHTLDLVITSSDTSLAPAVSCTHQPLNLVNISI